MPAIGSVLALSGWKSQGKPADEKLTCKSLSAECLDAGSATLLVSFPAGVPRCCFAGGLCSGFLFILIFLYATDSIWNAWKHCCKKYVSGNALLSLILSFSLFFACYC